MRKLMILLALSLTACGPNPAAGVPGTGGTGTGGTGTAGDPTGSKQAYVAFLQCVKSQLPAASQASMDAAIASVNAIPDAQWTAAGAAITANYKTLYATSLAKCAK